MIVIGKCLAEEVDDRSQAAERAELLRLERGQTGQSVLQGREDLDALDRVDAEVGVELHVEIEHLDGVSRLLGDDLDQYGGQPIRDHSGRLK